MASTKPSRKYPKKPKRDKDEFFMFKKDIPIVKKFKEKIQKMYEIQIHLDSKVDEGQWLIIFGDPVDRKSSKSYIQAICTPEERKVVQFPMHTAMELSDADKLEAIEIKTNACIKPLENIAQFEITGSELAVTLALSRLEELVGTSIIENAVDGDFNSYEAGVIKISPSTNCGRKRLSDKLERALSKNSDGGCSVDDYKHAKPSVQRVLLNCLQDDDADDIDDDALFDEGASEDANSNSKKNYKVHIYDDSDEMEIGNVSDKFADLNLSDLSDSEHKASDTEAVREHNVSEHEKYLQDYATSLGFEKQHIEYALTMVDASTRPSDFFSLVQKISTSRGSSVKQSVEVRDDISSDNKANNNEDDIIIESVEEVLITSPAEAPKAIRKVKTDIPEGYKEMLLRDCQQEDENCSVEELKRRNAERQKLLRENFEKQQINQASDGVSKKKRNKKNKNKQLEKNTPVEHPTSRTYSNDEDQTCVLRIYDTAQPSGSVGTLEEFTAVPNRKKDSGQTGPFTPGRPASTQGQKGFSRASNMPTTNQGMKEYHQYSNTQNTNQGQYQFTQPSAVQAMDQGQRPIGFSGNQVPQSSQGRTHKPMQAVVPVQLAGKSQSQGPVDPKDLRSIVIDGSNVAMTHGNGKIFSCRGIQICVDYFKQRGHDLITVFVPNWRNCRPGPDNNILDQEILQELKDKGVLVFTPSRKIGRKMVAAYDDRFVLELAEAEDAIIVSNDQYRDLMEEKAIWKNIIHTRLLMYSFVRDLFMPPNDPLGRTGPNLDDFLRVSTDLDRFAPYQHFQPRMDYPVTPKGRGGHPPSQGYYQTGLQDGHNCNTGYKNNPSSPYKPVIIYSDEVDGATKPLFNTPNKGTRQNAWANTGQGQNAYANPGQGQSAWANTGQGQNALANTGQGQNAWANKGQGKNAWVNTNQGPKYRSRSEQVTQELLQSLLGIFPEQEETVRKVLNNHSGETNIEKLANYCVGALSD